MNKKQFKHLFAQNLFVCNVVFLCTLTAQGQSKCIFSSDFSQWLVGTSFVVHPQDTNIIGFYDTYLPYNDSARVETILSSNLDSLFASILPFSNFPHGGIFPYERDVSNFSLGFNLQGFLDKAGVSLIIPYDFIQSGKFKFNYIYQTSGKDTLQITVSSSLESINYQIVEEGSDFSFQEIILDIPMLQHSGDDSLTITIIKDNFFSNYNLFAVDDLCVYQDMQTSIELYPKVEVLHIFPSVAQDQIEFKIPRQLHQKEIKLLDTSGRFIREFDLLEQDLESTISIPVSFLKSGQYYIRIVDDHGGVHLGRFVRL